MCAVPTSTRWRPASRGAMRAQVAQAADAGAELAARMAQAGNWNRLRLAREQGFQADAVLRQALAQQRLVGA